MSLSNIGTFLKVVIVFEADEEDEGGSSWGSSGAVKRSCVNVRSFSREAALCCLGAVAEKRRFSLGGDEGVVEEDEQEIDLCKLFDSDLKDDWRLVVGKDFDDKG